MCHIVDLFLPLRCYVQFDKMAVILIPSNLREVPGISYLARFMPHNRHGWPFSLNTRSVAFVARSDGVMIEAAAGDQLRGKDDPLI